MSGRVRLARILVRLDDLRRRSPIVVTTQKRQSASERNAFVLGVDWGTFQATDHEAARETKVVA